MMGTELACLVGVMALLGSMAATALWMRMSAGAGARVRALRRASPHRVRPADTVVGSPTHTPRGVGTIPVSRHRRGGLVGWEE